MKKFNYLDKLIANSMTAKKAICIEKIIIEGDSCVPDILAGIYIIKEKNGNIQSTFDQFKKFKDDQSQKKKRNEKNKNHEEKEIVLKCPKLNSPSEILYVGSSTTGVKERLYQHTTQASASTYALRLNEWFSGKYEIEIRVYEVTNEVLQLIEDNLSFNLKPAFGKRGPNNR